MVSSGDEINISLFILMSPYFYHIYLNRGSFREEHVVIKDKEKLTNDKYLSCAKRLILILCLWSWKSMVLVLRNLQIF